MLRRLKQRTLDRLGITTLGESIDELDAARAVHNGRLDDLTGQVGHLDNVTAHHEQRLLEIVRTERILKSTLWTAAAPLRHRPLISVVLATRNRAELLREAIASIIDQTYDHWELVVVDDGSTDETASMLDDLAADDSRVIVHHGGGGGPSGARNEGLRHATGTYVAFLDDDNLMAPGWLRAVAEFTGRSPDADALYGVGLRDDTEHPESTPWLLFEADVDLERLREHNAIDLGVLAVRRDHPELHFDESLDRYVDWEMVVRIAERGTLVPLPVVASIYTTRAADRISDAGDDERLDAMQQRLRR